MNRRIIIKKKPDSMRITIKALATIFLFTVSIETSNALDTQQTGRKKVNKDGKQYVETKNRNKETVYYCKGSKAYTFHLYRDCSGLNQCKSDIVEMQQKAAQDSTRKWCKNCWNRLQREKK